MNLMNALRMFTLETLRTLGTLSIANHELFSSISPRLLRQCMKVQAEKNMNRADVQTAQVRHATETSVVMVDLGHQIVTVTMVTETIGSDEARLQEVHHVETITALRQEGDITVTITEAEVTVVLPAADITNLAMAELLPHDEKIKRTNFPIILII